MIICRAALDESMKCAAGGCAAHGHGWVGATSFEHVITQAGTIIGYHAGTQTGAERHFNHGQLHQAGGCDRHAKRLGQNSLMTRHEAARRDDCAAALRNKLSPGGDEIFDETLTACTDDEGNGRTAHFAKLDWKTP